MIYNTPLLLKVFIDIPCFRVIFGDFHWYGFSQRSRKQVAEVGADQVGVVDDPMY